MNSCLTCPYCVLTCLPCREVVTFNHFLEAAAEKEVQGKARLQDFIENLLHRVELAEKQLEYYHGQHAAGLHWDTSEHGVSMQIKSQVWGCQVCEVGGKGRRKGSWGVISENFLAAAGSIPLATCCGSDADESKTPGRKWNPGGTVASSLPSSSIPSWVGRNILIL